MSQLALQLDYDAIPDGIQWPQPDTLVLLNRDLRPGTDYAQLSRFRDDRWDLNPAIFEDHTVGSSLNFLLIPSQLRLDAKYYLWQLLNHQDSKGMRRSAVAGRPGVRTVLTLFLGGLQQVLRWFAERGVTAFAQVTTEMLDDYLTELIDEEADVERKYRKLTEIRRLWAHRESLPARMRLPAAPPWGGEDTSDLLGQVRGDAENRTARIGEQTMQMLLHWAIVFVENLAGDILAAHADYLQLHSRSVWQRRQTTGSVAGRRKHDELVHAVTAYLADLRERGGALPGKLTKDGGRQIHWSHLIRILDCSTGVAYTSAGRMITESGLPVDDDIYLSTPITAVLNGKPWRRRIGYNDAPELARLLSTACFVIIAYLSGARPGEVLNLRRGCVERDPDTELWLMRGLYFKGAVDDDGNKIPEGQIRPDPWVVIELVAQAVGVLERLHQAPLLFPARIENRYQRTSSTKRQGEGRTAAAINEDLGAFVGWVNARCDRENSPDKIPDDGRGRIASSRFRRTLAWFIRRQPRGLIAASIQYGHAHTRMLQGYAGSFESGFPDDYAFEDWLFRMEGLSEDEEALRAGEHVSGPAAEAYLHRVKAANRQFAGHVLTTGRQARDLLGNPLLQIHHGQSMTCVFNPATAACQLRTAADDPMVTPDIDDCRPKCPNLARTDRDIVQIKEQAAELAEIVADPLAPPIRLERERHELARLEAAISAHEHGQ